MIRNLISVILFLSFNCFYLNHAVYAQNEDPVNPPSVDTVIIVKDPIIIVQKVYVETEKKKRADKHWIDISISPVFHDNIFYQNTIPLYYNYMLKLEANNHPTTGYAFGLSYTYFLKNVYLNTSLSLTTYRDEFIGYYTTPLFPLSIPEEITNTYTYVEGSLNAGYEISLNRFHIIPYIGIIVGRLTAMNGKTFSPEDEETIVDLEDADLFVPYTYSGTGGIKLALNVSKKTRILTEPFYREDLQSVMKSSLPFSMRRKAFGVKLGLAFAF